MIVAIWGQDGIGKSTLADALAQLFIKKEISLIIDTDLTTPTLPARILAQTFDSNKSLGKALRNNTSDTYFYMHQHPKYNKLFYAGLTNKDDILSYEIGLEAINNVKSFIDGCKMLVDNIILDISGQRNDPFVPYVLMNADVIIMPITPNIQGVNRYNSVKSLIESMDANDKIIPIAIGVNSFNDLKNLQKATNLNFSVVLPNLKDVAMLQDIDNTAIVVPKYAKKVKNLYKMIVGEKFE